MGFKSNSNICEGKSVPLQNGRSEMYLSCNASKARLREAENARRNRAEIVAARSQGQVTRRELLKWGIFTSGGVLVAKNGLSPFAKSAFAQVPTGTPTSPVPRPGDEPFIQPLLRLHNMTRRPLTRKGTGLNTELVWPRALGEPNALRRANTTSIFHTVQLAEGTFTGPIGPQEGRPPGEAFAHQRWDQLVNNTTGSHPFAPVGFVMSVGQIASGLSYNLANNWPTQNPDKVWTFGEGRFVRGNFPPVLIQARYGESVINRIYNNLPFFDPGFGTPGFPNNPNPTNGGFGRQEPAIHNHNGHNGAENDGAQNAHFFPGEYFDYHYSLLLARSDGNMTMSDGRDLDTSLGVRRGDRRASTPDGKGGLIQIPGDFREFQETLWFHDHRISFTSENVYKGYAGLLEYFSGPDRGNERIIDGVNLRLPSGFVKDWGNRDFDVYLLVQDVAFDPDGQLFFDIFDTDGFLGDVMHVNFQWKPTFQVLPRKYRFRTLSAGMSRHIKLAIADSLDPNTAETVPLTVIANDGNILPHFVRNQSELIIQGTAERIDFIVNFSSFPIGKKLYLVNLLEFSNGKKPDAILTLGQALSGTSLDPAVGAIMEFAVVSSKQSIDDPKLTLTIKNCCGTNDLSLDADPGDDWQIPIVSPVRERTIDFVRTAGADGGLPFDHPDGPEPWAIAVNGGAAHQADMRRSSNIPRPGDIEHWTLLSGGGWVHPVHLHFEEGVTMNRQGGFIHPQELLTRKDVWRAGGGPEAGNVQFQITFSEFGGAYVNHCHNTVHEDNAMLLRYDLMRDNTNTTIDDVHITVLPTPDPRPEGVTYVQSCFLPEGNPQGFDTGVDACPPGEIGPVVPSNDPRTF